MQSHKDSVEIVLALDIGGTFIKSSLFRGGVLIRRLEPVPSCSAGTQKEISDVLRRVFAMAGRFDRAAAAVPGPFDYGRGIFRMTHKFAAVNGCSLRELTDGVEPVCLHDAHAFLLGEMSCGAARGFARCGGITLGTGLGSAFAVDGRLIAGADGSPAPEVKLWNQPFRNGIAEDVVSGRALLRTCPAESVKAIADAARAGNEKALAAWRDYGSALWKLLMSWQAKFAPEVIVLGGKISRDLKLFGPVPEGLPIRGAELGDDAALYGAYQYAQRYR